VFAMVTERGEQGVGGSERRGEGERESARERE